MIISLPRITEAKRRDEKKFWAEFEDARPRLLGAVLPAVCRALRDFDAIALPGLPRMADFAIWVTAGSAAFGWKRDAFITAYSLNRGDADEVVLEGSHIAGPIEQLVDHAGAADSAFQGSAHELLARIDSIADPAKRVMKSWPKSPRTLSGQLRRIAPHLRAHGIEVEFQPRQGQCRPIAIRRIANKP